MHVAPLTGAWIETCVNGLLHGPYSVAPLTGAWIETSPQTSPQSLRRSHPSRVRGLKHRQQGSGDGR